MMQPQTASQRSGAYLVELAVVVSIFFLFLFGILEYSRLVFVRQVVFNAAREGARYAVVHVTSATLDADTKAVVKTRMCGLDAQTTYYNCQIYLSDSNGNSTGTGSASDAAFGQYIAVQVDYDYAPIMPSFLHMSNTIRITSRDLMLSEAN